MKNSKYIKDGYLVVGGVTQSGCIKYSYTDRTSDKKGEKLQENWATHKVVLSVVEQKDVSNKCYTLRRKVAALGTSINDFGVYVPRLLANELEAVLSIVNDEVDAYNKNSKYTSLDSNFTVFEISGGDEKVAKAIYSNTVTLLETINECIEKGDIKALRYAAAKIQSVSDLLPGDTGLKLKSQVLVTRNAAKKAVKAEGDSGTKNQKLERVVKELRRAKVIGLRSSLVESVRDMDAQKKKNSYVPNVNLIKARAIEVSMKAKPAKKAKKAAPKKKLVKKAPAVAKRDIE